MAVPAGTGDLLGGLGGSVSDIFGGVGQLKAASQYKKAAGYARQSAEMVKIRAAVEEQQAQREIYRTIGGQQADVAGAGFAASGTALDLLRDSMSQGSLTKQLIGVQGQIDVNGYLAQAASYTAMAKAAKMSGIGGIAGGVLKAAGTVATFAALSDDRMKENVVLASRRNDGLGIYHFTFKGSDVVFEGVLASEVERLYPGAVSWEDGYRIVDYGKVGVEPKVVSRGEH